LLAATWRIYGDGDGDGVKDRYNPADAIPGAANLRHVHELMEAEVVGPRGKRLPDRAAVRTATRTAGAPWSARAGRSAG
jgi:membrane-bound lytic murein transglycosylase B